MYPNTRQKCCDDYSLRLARSQRLILSEWKRKLLTQDLGTTALPGNSDPASSTTFTNSGFSATCCISRTWKKNLGPAIFNGCWSSILNLPG